MAKPFNYSYSASQKEELEAIRKKYAAPAAPSYTDKLEQLRRLDAAVTSKAATVALCVGIVCVLIMGFGMSLVMTPPGATLGIGTAMLLGVVTGAFGLAGVIAAYPLYRWVLARERKKAAPRILKLTEELSQ